jgi:hypothetical protein
MNAKALLKKIQALPPERIVEIEDFVDFIVAREQERSLRRAAAELSKGGFAVVWEKSGRQRLWRPVNSRESGDR